MFSVGGTQVDKEREVRLRRRIEELVRSRVGLLEQDISNLQREINDSFNRLLERTDVAGSIEESDGSLGQIAAEVGAQIDQAGAESVRLGADIALLRDSVAELDQQKSQADVLNSLVSRAANFAPRLVLFVVKANNALAWAARGLDDSHAVGQIRGLSISLQTDTALRTALHSQQTFYGSPEDQAENDLIFSRLGNIHPQRVLAVPLKVRGKCAAVIYADSAERGEDATNVEAIELLVQTAGLVVELVSFRARMSEATQAATKRPDTPVASAPTPTSQPSAPLKAEIVETPPSAPTPEAPPESQRPETAAYDEPQSTIAVEPEPAQAEDHPVETSEVEASAPSHVSAVLQAQPSDGTQRSGSMDEEEKLHNDARRFARLLVSEIKLYNEQKVTDGRRNGDLYGRLKDDIERSRQMYEKRVTPAVATKADYFYDELVNTLAEGDVSKLGSDYPGPSASMAG